MQFLPPGIRPRASRRGRVALVLGLAFGAGVLASGCQDGVEPGDLPFGWAGVVRITVEAPKAVEGLETVPLPDQGLLRQSIEWRSDGRWQLTEGIYYRGKLGDETVRKSFEDPATLAQRYGTWIAAVNNPASGFQLYPGDDPSPSLVPPSCAQQSRVTVQIVDSHKADSLAWTRCGDGTMGLLSAEGAQPGAGAARVIEAAKQLRDATLPFDRDFKKTSYAYGTTLPFGTLKRGELSRAPIVFPRIIEDAAAWSRFWSDAVSASEPLPPVDFSKEIVFVGAVGARAEAGDSLEIRAVVPVEFGTQVNMQEQRLGDFCTPAPREHTPFHIVVSPSVPLPILFALQEKVELVPCG